ncbi:hypothetical protein [Aureimonas leprariae]|uniref:Uncharacterized protein n=1 Tax=Plantimonas leprariae TaxID=2615207 RepID=A0A7V7PPU1_9HYPH|nr:hypothetical protein [Aureimonas leprariae]KAB0680064.1 hypothetical protein F6X38_09645 [Aureimonas leprariae]
MTITVREAGMMATMLAASLLAALPAYFWAIKRQETQHRAAELALFDADCRLARFRLAQGGELWSARIMANRCAARGH